MDVWLKVISKIQIVVYYQCCVLIGLATTRLYVIHCNFQGVIITPLVGLI